ncbi:DUF6122 family protein [Mangrovimonas spongiae]|uniref:Metal-dependent hydrolase n=1 Tax=Mangrovimonas spongiae TaxID=2494697 RepID=A0A3R9NQB9_9FLAO|nr:DUF6122 family protein [Mangrovimonas spongiae]RSK39238.1 hypothetical protein EJA19_09905 [Mangrovimonas spongiae]
MMRFFVHYGCHFILPIVIVLLFFKSKWKQAALIMLAAIFIDLDHLLATPIFDSNRCSIGFHPLHSYYAMGFYVVLLFPKATRVIGVGLLLHILADSLDCLLM